jgi:Zn-dependent peptidase ImmA (M78 family)
MSLRTDPYYRGLVEARLRQAQMTEPPVSVEELAGRLGVPVRAVHFPSWFTGCLVVQDGMPVMLLNEIVSPEGRRAAIGHMLSHVIMRIDDPDTPYPRGEERDHRKADMMAEEFVMPSFMVLEQARKWFNDYRYLARLFGVSETDMMGKMRDMGLIKARGVLWDY